MPAAAASVHPAGNTTLAPACALAENACMPLHVDRASSC